MKTNILLYKQTYNDNKYFLLYKKTYNKNICFYCTRRCIMTINIFIIQEDI